MARPAIRDLSCEQIYQGIVNLGPRIAEVDDEISALADRRAELLRDRSTLEALMALKSAEMAAAPSS